MHVTEATPAEAPDLVALINAAYRPAATPGAGAGWTDERDLLDGPRVDADAVLSQMRAGRFLLLRRAPGGPVLACAHLSVTTDGAVYVSFVAVDPARQAGGLGAAILAEAERRAVRDGLSRLRISVIAQRAALIGWYERRGFVRTGATIAFPYGDPSVGRPLRDDLELVVLEKALPS